jgi:sulfur-oxidizing protein SoxX
MRTVAIALGVALIAGPAALAQQKPMIDPARVDAVVKSAFPSAPADWAPRLIPDETMKQCSAHNNLPPQAVSNAIMTRERATIEYPADGKFIGDWKNGERVAQSGFGLRFTDYPPGNRVNGGNCYACHQITKAEVSFGTIGPSLYNYGKIRGVGDVAAPQAKPVVEYTWAKLWNAKAFNACSGMPRFGHAGLLGEAQLRDLMALLLDPKSPVNQ